MAEFPALHLWTDAYLADTTHLTTLENGAYLLLLMAAWRSPGCRLPNDDKLLARFARLTPGQWQRIKPTIIAFWTVENGHIYQGRLTDEYNAVRQLSSRQSDKAKARWLKNKDSADAVAMPEPCRIDASLTLTPTHTPLKKETPNGVSKKVVDDDLAFDEFWSNHPRQRRGSKEKARSAWKAALTRASAGDILLGLKAYVASDEVKRGFAKGAAAWLNDDRWTTDYVTFREQTAAEQLKDWVNGDERNDSGSGTIDGEYLEVPGGGPEGHGNGLLPCSARSERRGHTAGDGGADSAVGQVGPAQAGGPADDRSRIAALTAKAAKACKT